MIKSPGSAVWNLGLAKYFPLAERVRLRWELSATNIMNHPNYANPEINISNAAQVGVDQRRRRRLGARPHRSSRVPYGVPGRMVMSNGNMEAGYPVTERISVDPNVCSGKPVIRGTRILVRNILGMVAGGYTVDRIVESYPELTRDDVQAALEYAATVIDEEQVIARG